MEGGKTPPLPVDELHGLGFSIVLYANFLMRVMLHAGKDALTHLRTTGESASYADRMLSWQDRQSMFRLDDFGDTEDAFLSAWGSGS